MSVRSLVVALLSFAARAAPVAGVLAAAAGCGGHASAEDCAKMMDHYVDLAVQESPGAATMAPAQAAAVREVERGLKRAEPSYRRVEDRCATVARSEARCALGATTTSEWEACLASAHPDAR
ncbi:MAG: hypothetical protein ACRENE_16805 [Polyangiaceae bacterium]